MRTPDEEARAFQVMLDVRLRVSGGDVREALDWLAAHVGRLSAEVDRLKRREAAQRGARKRGKT